ncbi:hypothetical protein CsSME_00043445 [Camellia sinensis var. sinensis]
MGAAVTARKLLLQYPLINLVSSSSSSSSLCKPLLLQSPFSRLHSLLGATNLSATTGNNRNKKNKVKQKMKEKAAATAAEAVVKRRTRSGKEFDEKTFMRYGDSATHIPVMLGEVLDVFASVPLLSFVDCTVGAAGHSSAVSTTATSIYFPSLHFLFTFLVDSLLVTHSVPQSIYLELGVCYA